MQTSYSSDAVELPLSKEEILQDGFIRQRWDKKDAERSSILTRSEQYAEWTIPSVFPRAGTEGDEQPLDYQSLGAEAVNTMSNKLGMTLLTPHRPFFRLNVTPAEMAEMNEAGLSAPQVDSALSHAEREAMAELERMSCRPAVVDASKMLLITGNALLDARNDSAQAYNLRNYVVSRDAAGNIIEIIMCTEAALLTFSPELQEDIRNSRTTGNKDNPTVQLYTYIRLMPDGKWYVIQAADDFALQSTAGGYKKDELPWIVLTWNRNAGDDYGRGLVEDYRNDFHALSNLYQAGINLVGVLCDIKFLVDPRGGVDIETLNNSETGTYVAGSEGGVTASTKGVQAPEQLLQYYIDKIERRIGRAFLMGSAGIRDAERVTAEEIRFLTSELNAAHSSAFSTLSQHLQQRLAKLLLKRIDFDVVKSEPTIVTGLDSLARSTDNDNLRMWLQDLAILEQVPPSLLQILKKDNIAAKLGAGYGITSTDYVMSAEEQEAAAAAQQDQALMMAASESMGQAVGTPRQQ